MPEDNKTSRNDERMGEILEAQKTIKEDVKDINTKIDNLVTRKEFEFVRNIILAACGFILIGFLGILVTVATNYITTKLNAP